MRTCVIVGGGVVGLLCALVARGSHDRVVLVEKGASCGGLLGSMEHGGAIYDYGTHVPAPTRIDALDELLYGGPQRLRDDYEHLPYLLSENFHNGRWNPSSPLIDTRTLAEDLYHRGVVETLMAGGADPGERNLYRTLVATFGPTFTESIYRPVLRKIQGAELEQIDREVLRLFGLQRLIALTPEATRELKRLPRYDAAFGYHSYTEGTPGWPYVYPRGNRGIGYWPDQLEGRLRRVGAEILTGQSVARILHSGGRATGVELEGGARIDCDRIVWTIPAAHACRAAGLQVPGPRPQFRHHTLVHVRYARPLLKTRPQYLLCWDPAYLSYRITLYPNITADRRASGIHNLTVEVLGDESSRERSQDTAAAVERELVAMGVVEAGNPVVDRFTTDLGPTFPVLTSAFLDASQAQVAALRAGLRNLLPLGRGGPAFLINDLLTQAWQAMQEAA